MFVIFRIAILEHLSSRQVKIHPKVRHNVFGIGYMKIFGQFAFLTLPTNPKFFTFSVHPVVIFTSTALGNQSGRYYFDCLYSGTPCLVVFGVTAEWQLYQQSNSLSRKFQMATTHHKEKIPVIYTHFLYERKAT